MMPAFSIVLYASRRFRSDWARAYNTPRMADMAPTAITANPQLTSGTPRPNAHTRKSP